MLVLTAMILEFEINIYFPHRAVHSTCTHRLDRGNLTNIYYGDNEIDTFVKVLLLEKIQNLKNKYYHFYLIAQIPFVNHVDVNHVDVNPL